MYQLVSLCICYCYCCVALFLSRSPKAGGGAVAVCLCASEQFHNSDFIIKVTAKVKPLSLAVCALVVTTATASRLTAGRCVKYKCSPVEWDDSRQGWILWRNGRERAVNLSNSVKLSICHPELDSRVKSPAILMISLVRHGKTRSNYFNESAGYYLVWRSHFKFKYKMERVSYRVVPPGSALAPPQAVAVGCCP